MNKSLSLLAIFLLLIPFVNAENIEQERNYRHEIRIGIGDCLMEYIMDGTVSGNNYQMENRRYTGNIYADYHYNINTWLAVGAQVRTSGCIYDNYQNIEGTSKLIGEDHYRITTYAYPQVRFTYFNRPSVRLYSGIGLGFMAFLYDAQNTENNRYMGTLPITLLGISVGKKHWYGTADLNILCGFNDKVFSPIPLNILNIGVGYRF